jgi:hypothetical protein
VCFSNLEFDLISQVGVSRTFTSVSPPYLWERGQIGECSKPEFDWIFHVGVSRKNTSVSPLYLWERARVRASGSHSFTQKTQIPYKMRSPLRLNSPRCEAI